MNMHGNTILITGGTSGIGRALAEAFAAQDNKVIIAGRRQELLDEVVGKNPAMRGYALDVEKPESIRGFAEKVIADNPKVNVLINNAGVMRAEKLQELSKHLGDAEATITTNLLGPIRLTAAFLPHFLALKDATIVNVTSGLAFVPLTSTPTYCATKAALHSYTQSLRTQLEGTSTKVIELAPPAVATDLMAGHAANPNSMPLKDYIDEVMALFKANPSGPEINVERVKMLRFAEAEGRYAKVYGILNGAH